MPFSNTNTSILDEPPTHTHSTASQISRKLMLVTLLLGFIQIIVQHIIVRVQSEA
jgi:hypothetical protein